MDQVIVVCWTRRTVTATIQNKFDPLPEGVLVKEYPLEDFHPRIFESKRFSGVLGEQPRQAVIDALVQADKLPFLERSDPWLVAWFERKKKSLSIERKSGAWLLEAFARADGFRFDPWAMLAR